MALIPVLHFCVVLRDSTGEAALRHATTVALAWLRDVCARKNMPCESTSMPSPCTIYLPHCLCPTGAAGDINCCRPRSSTNSPTLSGQTCIHLALHHHCIVPLLKGTGRESLRETAWVEMPPSQDIYTRASLQYEHMVTANRGSRTSALGKALTSRCDKHHSHTFR